jgi:hypothetical protein
VAKKREVYTYYYPDGRVEIREGVLQPEGAAWIDGAYQPPLYPSALNVRVGKGVKVATIIAYLQAAEGDVEAVLTQWHPDVTPDDIAIARWFYESNPLNKTEIDEKYGPHALSA